MNNSFRPDNTIFTIWFKASTCSGETDCSDYIRELQLDISGCDLNRDRVRLGEVAADQVKISGAQIDRVSLLNVCDDSSGTA